MDESRDFVRFLNTPNGEWVEVARRRLSPGVLLDRTTPAEGGDALVVELGTDDASEWAAAWSLVRGGGGGAWHLQRGRAPARVRWPP